MFWNVAVDLKWLLWHGLLTHWEKDMVLWHAIQSGRLLWIWHPLWIVFDIAETFCWYEHLVMMFRHVSRIMQMAVYLFFDTTPHYRCYIVTVVFSIPMPRTEIVWAVVKMFLIHICKRTCPFIEIFLPRGFTMQLPGGFFIYVFHNKIIQMLKHFY